MTDFLHTEEGQLFQTLGDAADQKLVELKEAPPAPPAPTFIDLCACGHQRKQSEMPIRVEADGRPYVDNVCLGCRATFAHNARLVCEGCRRALACVKPGTTESGFRYEPAGVYHMSGCPACQPSQRKFLMLEQAAYEQLIPQTKQN